MARRFQVWPHRQLCARNGDVVASGGESVAADHPAVLALVDPPSIGHFVVEDEPATRSGPTAAEVRARGDDEKPPARARGTFAPRQAFGEDSED